MREMVEMDSSEVAETIRKQIGAQVFMSLGAHKLRYGKIAPTAVDDFLPSLIFKAKILPFKKDGTRGSGARVMQVSVGLNGSDLYDVRATYRNKGVQVVHYEADDVDAEMLPSLLLSLDYDGETTTNPRFA